MDFIGTNNSGRWPRHAGHDHGSEEELTDEMAYNALIAKGITMVVLCSVSVIMGLVPLQMAKWFGWENVKSANDFNVR